MGKFGHSKFTSQQMFPIGNDKPWKRQPLTKDCGSNFSTLDRYIDSQFARHFVPMSRIHWRYIFLHMYSGMSGDHWCQLTDYETGTSERSLTHQVKEQPDNLGEPEKLENRPHLGLGCRLVSRKHFSFFRSSTRVFRFIL